MIPTSRPDRLRLAKLGGAVLSVLAFAAWRVVGSVSDDPVAGLRRVFAIGGERPKVAVRAPELRTAALPLPDPGASGALIDPDPFRPLEVAKAPSPAAEPAPSTLAPSTLAGAIVPEAATPLKVSPTGAAPKASPAMRLTGVVVGGRPTAVVMIGDEEIVVRPGARLPDGSRLVRIDDASVTLDRAGQTAVLWVAD